MRTKVLVSLMVVLCVVIGVGQAAASEVRYLDGSDSLAINLGNGSHAFVFANDLIPPDYFIHIVDFFADLRPENLVANTFNGTAFHLVFEGISQGLMQYSVYSCLISVNRFSCSVSGTFRGSLFL